MSLLVLARDMLDESVALADAASLRLRGRPFVFTPAVARKQGRSSPHGSAPVAGLPVPVAKRNTRPKSGAYRTWLASLVTSISSNQHSLSRFRLPALHFRATRHALLLTAAALGVPTASAWGIVQLNWPHLAAQRERMQAIIVNDESGAFGGAIARPNGLVSTDGEGIDQPRVTLGAGGVPDDFWRAAVTKEGQGIFGVNPVNLVRGIVCQYVVRHVIDESSWFRLHDGRCAGGSTLAMQSIRALVNDKDTTARRKANEVFRAIALNLHFLGDEAGYRTFVSDTLFFGNARGTQVYGLRAASLVMFGKEPTALELHESTLLAAALLYPIALNCGPASQNALNRFEEQRGRALDALDKGFANDPRYAQTRATLQAMAPITAPAASPTAVAAGLSPDAACRASPPLLTFESLDSSVRLAALTELSHLVADGASPREVRLAINFASQVRFKGQVEQARAEIAAGQGGHWYDDPRGSDVVTLAFTTASGGSLSALYESSSDLQLNHLRDLGSLSKIFGLVFLAERGWSVDLPFCNKSARISGHQLHNAGRDVGVPDCSRFPAGRLSVGETFGRSVSLAVFDSLRQFPEADLRRRLLDWGVSIPDDLDARYAVAFGLVRTTPSHLAAFYSAISAGLAGGAPYGYEATAIAAWRSQDGSWHPMQGNSIDLSSAFSTPASRALISAGAGAAYSRNGTLAALGPAIPGSLGKTGTLDSQIGQVRFKGAAGALAGRSWFAMIVPERGALGNSTIGIMPLANVTKDAMLDWYEPDTAGFPELSFDPMGIDDQNTARATLR